VSYEEEEDTCVCTPGTKHVSYEEEEDPPHTLCPLLIILEPHVSSSVCM